MVKYVKLAQVESLLKTLAKRDSYDFWNNEYENQHLKLQKSIDFIRRNAIELEVNNVQSSK